MTTWAAIAALCVVGIWLSLQAKRRRSTGMGAIEVISKRQLAPQAWLAVVTVRDGSGPRTLVISGGGGPPRLITELERQEEATADDPVAPTLLEAV